MQDPPIAVMLIEDDPLFVQAITLALCENGGAGAAAKIEVTCFSHTEAALLALPAARPEIIVLDINLGGHQEGLEALPKILAARADTPVLVHSVQDDYATIVRAMRQGAYDYVPKLAGPERLRAQIITLAAQRRQRAEKSRCTDPALVPGATANMVGQSLVMRQLRAKLEKISDSQGSVVIEGESGAGKELVARALCPKNAPFVAVDAATLEPSLAASLLFGHERGAFTGAERTSVGLFEQAHGGVLFLDEIANMSLEVQAKLLRVLQEREICRLGSTQRRPVHFRVICATHASVPQLAEEGRFRFDLYMRLKVFHLRVPSLRERTEDILPLFDCFLGRLCRAAGRLKPEVHSATRQLLEDSDWPGNVRQLAHAAEYAVAMAQGAAQILPEHLPDDILEAQKAAAAPNQPAQKAASSFRQQMQAHEYSLLSAAYRRERGNVSAMARSLKMDRTVLFARLTHYAIHRPRSL